ncbi:hypothetical protein MIND_00377100 [Mycena indigotica]|uniref:Uncharacterized protein n=1 Tax=Mycena indigotica TaxID=2126181 RepID=A0A8H6T2V7_9AGAR|nr:uncharacterized protein MIND_00377100 [Mycena indigotica]KAF7310041.1 hypothetical protein MIND_00377100 [Mycena indigotica]
MERLPTELHELILDSVATSHSKAIRSLSFASHYFHHLALPYRFHTIRLDAAERVARLRLELEALPEHRRRIYRVFVALRRSNLSALSQILRILQLSSRTLRDLAVIDTAHLGATAASAFGAVLRTAAPFQGLERLTLRGRHPALPSSDKHFPALRYLDTGGNTHPIGLPVPWSWLGSRVTVLRVVGLSAALGFATELRNGLAAIQAQGEGIESFSIVVELTRQPEVKLVGNFREKTMHRQDAEMRRILTEIELVAKSARERDAQAGRVHVDVQVVVGGDDSNAGRIEQDWLEGVDDVNK